ncbi:winged helix-turn-helix domain-containing tetratricopeptide repeat protein [Mesorhizobium captivum]|uniref:winged helix-turn-helix domain-containing tetratricopeptide repeat protein n=1 Tax=Mesorhizobium captivum TaxID=3072319 RepID=UPI002A24C767|nr:winged helix-turn-helix domain-containing protein [Mesorhizobium sp. VK23E]MDX8516407.1 winged helix-turn-helix domain-containing protein [Mesorhizobium sp. VK23E]
MALQIGGAVLDLDRGTLRRDGEIVPVRPKTLELLAYLTRNPGRVLSKEELLQAVWPGIIVSEDSLTQSIHDARKSIGDEAQALIRTVPRRGYLFQAPEVEAAPPPAAMAVARAEPMVAVLPFHVDPADSTAKALFDGAVEEITNALSYFKTVAVLARHSAFALAEHSRQDIRATAERLGADYVGEGDVETSEAEYSARVVLTETATGRRVWAQSFTFAKGEIFAFQTTVAQRIVTALVANIESAVMRRGLPAAAANVEAYLHFLRGKELLRSYGERVNQDAREHFLKAIELDPRSGLANAYLALADVIIGGYADAPRTVLDGARDRALHAIALSPDEARCHRMLALILLYRGRDEYDAAEKHFARALDLNPYDADTLAQTGFFRALRGDGEAGLALLDKAVQLNPMHPTWYYYDRGEALLAVGRYQEAAASFSCLPRKSAWQWARLAACHAFAGDQDKALACVREGRALEPGLTIAEIVQDMRMEREEDRERLRGGLELAGWDTAS